MQKLMCALFLFIASSCFAINFGPGPGGGGNHDQEQVENDNPQNLLVDETAPIPAKAG